MFIFISILLSYFASYNAHYIVCVLNYLSYCFGCYVIAVSKQCDVCAGRK